MSILQIYVERASQSRNEAASASLINIRDRCLRSALAWEAMADQLRLTETYQLANEVARSASIEVAP